MFHLFHLLLVIATCPRVVLFHLLLVIATCPRVVLFKRYIKLKAVTTIKSSFINLCNRNQRHQVKKYQQ